MSATDVVADASLPQHNIEVVCVGRAVCGANFRADTIFEASGLQRGRGALICVLHLKWFIEHMVLFLPSFPWWGGLVNH